MRTRAVLALLLVGCGGYTGSGGIALGIDAPGAALVVLQDGDQPFRQVPLDEFGSAVVSVKDGAYGVGVFCPFDMLPVHRARFVYDTEAGVVSSPCEFPDVPFVRLAGTTQPGAEVWSGQFGPVIADETGAYDTTAPQGDTEIIAFVPGATPRMFLRRVTANADRVVDLPIATDGVDLIAVTPTVTNALQGEYTVSSDMNTPSTFIQFTSSASAIVHVPPPNVLEEVDRVTISASAGNCTVQQPAAVIAPSFRIPSPLAMSLDRTQVAWTADPTIDWQSTVLRMTKPGMLGTTERTRTIVISATPSWHAVQGSGDVIRIIDPATDIPGWTTDLVGFTAGDSIDVTFSLGRGRFDGELASCGERTTLVW